MERKAWVERKTKETLVRVEVSLDGCGKGNIRTGISFFDHMLDLLARHSLIDMDIWVEGDLLVDCHHTVEDTGMVLGQAVRQALGNKEFIRRYASLILPMDETLVSVALDVSGRPFFQLHGTIESSQVGDLNTQAVEEFLQAFCVQAGMTLHISLLHGKNTHHMIEAIFKGLARTLREACSLDMREQGIPSTKGIL